MTGLLPKGRLFAPVFVMAGPEGGVPVTVAVLLNVPESISV